jgi:hypothetical protein
MMRVYHNGSAGQSKEKDLIASSQIRQLTGNEYLSIAGLAILCYDSPRINVTLAKVKTAMTAIMLDLPDQTIPASATSCDRLAKAGRSCSEGFLIGCTAFFARCPSSDADRIDKDDLG